MLKRSNELAGFQRALVGTSVQPGVTALQNLNLKLIALQIGIIHCGYLQLAACTWLDGFDNINDLIVVKVQSCDCVIAFKLGTSDI